MNQINCAISCGYRHVSVLAKENDCALVGVFLELARSLMAGMVLSLSAISSLTSVRPTWIEAPGSHADSAVVGEVLDRIFSGSAFSLVGGAVTLELIGEVVVCPGIPGRVQLETLDTVGS